jgi:hypothetical protein
MPQSLYAIIDSQEVPVISAKATWTQGQVGTCEFSILARNIDYLNITFSDWSLIREGNVLLSGLILDTPALELNEDRALVVRVSAVDEIGRLTCLRAVSDAHFQDTTIPNILNFLLAGVPNFILGDTSTMIDPNVKTTLDLRAKESLFAQIAEAIKSVPRTFFRYGGTDNLGRHRLDVGFFGSQSAYIGQHDNLADLALQRNTKRQYKYVEAYGGRSKSTRPTLCDAKDALLSPTIAARTLADPDYAQFPIVTLGGKCVVNNTALARGCEITKEFQINKTENSDAPTNEERAEAAYAVYKKAVRFLQENKQYRTYTGSGYFASPPRIGDNAYVQAAVSEPVYDSFTQAEVLQSVFELHESLRLTKLSVDFARPEWRETSLSAAQEELRDYYTFEVTDNDYAEEFDDDAELYDRFERTDSADEESEAALGLKRVDVVPVSHPASSPSDAVCLPTIAKRFVFPLPPPPAGATQLFGSIVIVSPVTAIVNITQYPAYPSTPLIACVQDGSLAGWGTNDVSVSVRYDWI